LIDRSYFSQCPFKRLLHRSLSSSVGEFLLRIELSTLW
jgi:hypothetical protein